MADTSNESKYDVFLNSGGGANFVEHLYCALVKNGINTFKDDDDKQDWNVSSKVIEDSKFAIVIFSKSYASSSWCLDELVKIMECSKKTGLFVLPVCYYDFNLSYLRRQGSVFGELFSKYDMGKVRAWTSALVEAANLSASGTSLIDERYQENYIKEIVELVLSKLNLDQNAIQTKHDKLGDPTSSHEKLIGIKHRVDQVKKLLDVKPMKTTSNSALGSSSTHSSRWTRDVFLCFKGNDMCNDFADQLCRALEQQEIYFFRYGQGLARDKPIVSEHLQRVIEESSIIVVIFSKNYVAAACCLDELVKIIESNEKFGQIVLPVFYDVDPSDVRNQNSLFGQALMQNTPEKVEIWRKALLKAGSFAGWYLNGTPESHKAATINNIVNVISRRLVCLPSNVDGNLVGIYSRMKYVMSLLELESGGIRMLGICGMGGIGKTTIARVVFDQVSDYFGGSCFIENVRERSKKYGLEYLQKEVLSKLFNYKLDVRNVIEGANLIREHLAHHRVHMVLDDIDHISQLEALAGALDWFGEGTRIIITTRDENVLVAHNIMQNYYVKALDDDESSQFLRRHAFKNDDLTNGYEDLLPPVVSYAGGLPLALKVLSLLLCGKGKREWTNTMARLKVYPEKEIQDTLKISYDGLDDDEKNIFLDVACFFNGMEEDNLVRILDSCGFSGYNGIRLLERKSLLHISKKGCINMHHLVAQMGRDLVRQMHPDEPGKHSRLWHAEEVFDVLMEKTGTKEISAIVFDDMLDQHPVDLTEAFRGMKNLRLLQIHSSYNSRFLQGPSFLPNGLRWLTWKHYPLQSLPTSFKANKLVSLELVHCHLPKLQLGDKFMGKLQFLNLSYCRNLIKTPDFTGLPNLKELFLNSCTSLTKIDESIGRLKRLTTLNLSSCEQLPDLPQSVLQLSSLRYLNIDGCSKLKYSKLKLVFQTVDPRCLVELDLSSYMGLSLPKSLGSLKHQRGSPLYERLNMIRWFEKFNVERNILDSTSNHGLISESGTSQELIEDKKETLPPYIRERNITRVDLISESETSQELIEYKTEKLPLLPRKGV